MAKREGPDRESGWGRVDLFGGGVGSGLIWWLWAMGCDLVCDCFVCLASPCIVCMYVSKYVCMYVCMYVSIYIYIYIYMCVCVCMCVQPP